MDAPAHDGLLHGEAGRDRGERENESGTHHREVPLWLGRREEALQVLEGGGGGAFAFYSRKKRGWKTSLFIAIR